MNEEERTTNMTRSLKMIRKRIKTLRAQATRIEWKSTEGIRAAAKVISKYNLSLDDLKQAMAAKGRGSPLAGHKVPVKFRDKDGNTWTGRGRPPLWLVAYEKSGRKRDSLLVK